MARWSPCGLTLFFTSQVWKGGGYCIRRKTQELEESREEMTMKTYNYQKPSKSFPEIVGRVVLLDVQAKLNFFQMIRNHGFHGFGNYGVKYGLACKKNACVLSIRQKKTDYSPLIIWNLSKRKNNDVFTSVRINWFYLLDNRNSLCLLWIFKPTLALGHVSVS